MHAPAVDRAAWASPWRHRPLGPKLLLSLGLLAIAVVAPALPGALVVLAVAAASTIGWARTPLRWYLRALATPVAFVAIGAASVAVAVGWSTVPGALWDWGPFSVSNSSLRQAAELAARGFGGTAAVLVLACSTPVHDLLFSLRRLRIPDPLIDIAATMYQMIFAVAAATGQVYASQSARLGHRGPRRSWQSFGLLAAAVLVRSLGRARRLEDGLSGRGYAGSLLTLPPRRGQGAPRQWLSTVGILLVVGVLAFGWPR